MCPEIVCQTGSIGKVLKHHTQKYYIVDMDRHEK